ncbi:hypothetical protein AB0L85_25530 [Streptomyces sp. NPDC052051]|uniref:hypothetical protein n=1 Tax=Streptomyces sp. NPDC052051 TaxID=3154649 RepID=UPI003432063D
MELLTERLPVNGPVVYGFLRLAGVSVARQTALRASLAEYCRIHELRLSGVFKDRRATAQPTSTAFTGLLDALALPDAYGVIAPSLSHLGPKHLATERTRRIEATGAACYWPAVPASGTSTYLVTRPPTAASPHHFSS